MLQVDCKFSEKSSRMDELSGFDMGHMEFQGDLGTASSRSRVPDQAMMLIPSLVLLLDSLRRFLSSPQNEYEFVGADCSFIVVFSKKKGSEIHVCVDQRPIGTTDAAQLKADIEASISRFINSVSATLPAEDAAVRDLSDAFQAFQKFAVD